MKVKWHKDRLELNTLTYLFLQGIDLRSNKDSALAGIYLYPTSIVRDVETEEADRDKFGIVTVQGGTEKADFPEVYWIDVNAADPLSNRYQYLSVIGAVQRRMNKMKPDETIVVFFNNGWFAVTCISRVGDVYAVRGYKQTYLKSCSQKVVEEHLHEYVFALALDVIGADDFNAGPQWDWVRGMPVRRPEPGAGLEIAPKDVFDNMFSMTWS